jgi:hypothetical protein
MVVTDQTKLTAIWQKILSWHLVLMTMRLLSPCLHVFKPNLLLVSLGVDETRAIGYRLSNSIRKGMKNRIPSKELNHV